MEELKDVMQRPSIKAEWEASARQAREQGCDRTTWILMMEAIWDLCHGIERDDFVQLSTEAYDNGDDEPVH